MKRSDDDFEKLMRRNKVILIALVVAIVAPSLIQVFYIDKRMSKMEHALTFRTADPETGAEELPSATDYSELVHFVQAQTVYVPAYSHVYHQDGRPRPVTVTLSVRNTSEDQSILLKSVRYFNTAGKQVKSHLKEPLRIQPMATAEFLVEQRDSSGGSGANFLVTWAAEQAVSEPVVEAVMIDTSGQQGISFARLGKVISELIPAEHSERKSAQNTNK